MEVIQLAEAADPTEPAEGEPAVEVGADAAASLERFYAATGPAIERRERTMLEAGRCPGCWHNQSSACICLALQPLPFERKVRFLVYLHSVEFFNAGDDGKLLKAAAPDACELLVCGRRGDDVRLLGEVAAGNCVLLYPSEDALSTEELTECGFKLPLVEDGDAPPLRIVLLDGTWNRVKSMKSHLARLGCTFPHVRLRPESLDYWVRRGNRSVYSRTQTQPDRICTVEATALLLRELGESEANCNALIGYVELNNRRLRGETVLPPPEPEAGTAASVREHRCLKGQCRSCRARGARDRAKAQAVGCE